MSIELGNTTYYTSDEVAIALDKHFNTVKNYLQTGHLPAKKVNGAWLVSRSDLAQFIAHSQALPEAMIDHRLGITSPKSGRKLQRETV